MRVGLIVSGGVDPSGHEVIPALLWLIERLARRHDLHVFVLHHQRSPTDYLWQGAQIHDLGTRGVPRGWRRLVQRRRLRARLRGMPSFDVLHAWWGIPAGWVATSLPPDLRPPVVVTASSGEFVGDRTIAYGFQRRWLDRRLIAATMRRAAAVTVATRHMASLAARLGVRTTIVPHGAPREHADVNLERGPAPWRLIHIGHLNRVKDQATLLHAMAQLRERAMDVRLDVVGADTGQGECHHLASRLGLDPVVTFHGALPLADVRELLGRMHLHVMSSRHEAGGVAVIDAAAAGVPTVGTDVGYIADWSPDAAVAVPVGDARALADAITRVLNRPGDRAALATAAYARATAFSADDMAEAFERVYHATAAGSRRPGSAIA